MPFSLTIHSSVASLTFISTLFPPSSCFASFVRITTSIRIDSKAVQAILQQLDVFLSCSTGGDTWMDVRAFHTSCTFRNVKGLFCHLQMKSELDPKRCLLLQTCALECFQATLCSDWCISDAGWDRGLSGTVWTERSTRDLQKTDKRPSKDRLGMTYRRSDEEMRTQRLVS